MLATYQLDRLTLFLAAFVGGTGRGAELGVNIGVRRSRYGTAATPGSVASRVLATTRPGAPQPGQLNGWAVAVQTAPHRGHKQ